MAYIDQIEVDGVMNELQDSTARQQIQALSNVARSGNYNDLLNKPDLSGFITRSVNDLVNYYTKTETYTKTEVNNLVNAIKQFTYEVVATLPTASASTMYKIYLVPATTTETQNIKDEYITIQSGNTYSWEQIGSTAVDLSGYSTTEQMNAAIANALTNYYTKTEVDGKIDEMYSATIYDVSVLHPTSGVNGGSTYASLSAAIAVIPQDKRKGGMTVKFVQSSDNKYVQYRLMSDTFSTTVANWQGVDDEPTAGSENLVESGGVRKVINDIYSNIGTSPFTINGFIKNSNGIANDSGSVYKRTDYIKVSGTDIVIKGILVGDEPTAIAFYDSEKNFISAGYNNVNEVTISYANIPSGAVYFRCCTVASRVDSAYILQGNINDIYDKIDYNLELAKETSSVLSGTLNYNAPLDKVGFRNASDVIVSNENYRNTGFVNILRYKKLSYKLAIGSPQPMISFYDKNKTLLNISIVGTGSAVESYVDLTQQEYSSVAYFIASVDIRTISSGYYAMLSSANSKDLSALENDIQANASAIAKNNDLDKDVVKILSDCLSYNAELDKVGFLTKDGVFVSNENYRCTGLLHVLGYENIAYKLAIGSPQPIISFYDGDKNIIPSLSVIGTGSAVESYIDITQPQYANVVYFAASTDVRTISSGYYATLSSESSKTLSALESDIQANADAIQDNEIDIKRVKIGETSPFSIPGFIDLSGSITSNESYLHTDYLRLSRQDPLYVGGIYVGASSLGIAFYDADKTFISGYNSIREITIAVADFPSNAVYFRCGTLTTVAPVSNAIIVNSSLLSLSQKLDDQGSQSIVLPKFNTLKVLIFGDSISHGTTLTISDDKTTSYQWYINKYTDGQGHLIQFKMWPELVNNALQCADLRSYAYSGAEYKYAERGSGLERRNLKYQIDVAFNDLNNPNNVFPTQGAFVPDVIIFALGTNDGTPNDTYDTAMAKTIMNQAETAVDVAATLANLDLTKFNEAVRYAFLRVKNQFPHALMFCVLPIQRAQYNARNLTTLHDALKKMAETYSITVIDGAFTLGIVRDLETIDGLGASLKDGLHPTDIGQNMFARMIINVIKNNYVDLSSMN